jgi:hypothetical protein
MAMDCGQVDHGDCIDVGCCSSAGHASCDNSAKETPVLPQLADRSDIGSYAADTPERYLSHPAERLLRPPRNA